MKTTQRDIVALTQQLISIPSTADNLPALEQAVQLLRKRVSACTGVTIEQFTSNGKPSFLAYRGDKRPQQFDVILNAHVDVISGKPDQFKPTREGSKLYGRGALDMKGTAACMTAVFCEMVNKLDYALGLQIVSDEETGGYDGVQVHIDTGVRSRFVIMGEYANEQGVIYNAARGLCWAEIEFGGQAAHSGHLWNGTNAVVKASTFAAELLRHYPTPDKETWTTTASIASVTTPNTTFNQVPDQATLRVDFRFTQEDPVFENRGTLETFIASIDPTARLAQVSVFEPAIDVEELNPFVQGLSNAVSLVLDCEPSYKGRPAASDGRLYAQVGVDIVEFGLVGQGSHGDSEYIDTDYIEPYMDILREFLKAPIPGYGTQQKQHHSIQQAIDILNAEEGTTATPRTVNKTPQPQYVWYATYGTGLSREHFVTHIRGGLIPGSSRPYAGCRDHSLPIADVFMSLPHRTYLGGNCPYWNNSGYLCIDFKKDLRAHTIARGHLITLEQFTEIAADINNMQPEPLPIEEAMRLGHATIAGSNEIYAELVYCGMREDTPIFTLAPSKPVLPYVAPSAAYTKLLLLGLTENTSMSRERAMEYLLATPEIASHFQPETIADLLSE